MNPSAVTEQLGPGSPLDPAVRSTMSSVFGTDLSGVRMHTDPEAHELSRRMNAKAFAVGNHIAFSSGQYRPGTLRGDGLIAHELAHVIQQDGASGIASADTGGAMERDASRATAMAMYGLRAQPGRAVAGARPALQSGLALQRCSQDQPETIPAENGVAGIDVNDLLTQEGLPDGTTVDPARKKALQDFIDAYTQIRQTGALSPDEIAEVNQAILKAKIAVDGARSTAESGSSMKSGSTFMLGTAGVLFGDDVSGIGVADDPAAVVAGAVGLLLLLGAAIASNSQKEIAGALDSAFDAISDATAVIGGILMAQKAGEKAQGLTNQIAIHLARILGETVAGRPPDHQEDPERDRNHWWKEIKEWLKQIRENGQSGKQLLRDLLKKFTPEQLKEIRDALDKAAKKMNEPPPDFPSVP